MATKKTATSDAKAKEDAKAKKTTAASTDVKVAELIIDAEKAAPATSSAEAPAAAKTTATKKKKAHRLSAAKKLIAIIVIAALTFVGAAPALGIDLGLAFLKEGIGAAVPILALAVVAIIIVLYFPKPKKKGSASATAATDAATTAAATPSQARGNLLFEEEEDDLVNHNVDAGPLNFAFDKYSKQDVKEINGGLYSEVVKFDEKMRTLEVSGASDLDIIQTSMTGSAKFEDLLKTERTANTLSAKDIAQYAMSKHGSVTIKKRGDINWTFKYGSKSFLIVREGKDGYKVSVKCFPDAVVQLNKAFMALEDSSFPSGPIWFSFSELRNLPPKIIKWLIDTAHMIAKLQQLKTDLLRTFKTSEELGINEQEILDNYKAGKTLFKSGKFTLVFQKGNEADLKVMLVDPVEGLDSKGFTKELYYKFIPKEETGKKRANAEAAAYPFAGLNLTMLPDKSVNEEVQVSFFERIEEILSK